jgi:hypothetical protein
LTIVDLINSIVVAFKRVQLGKNAHDLRHQDDQTRELNREATVNTRIQLSTNEFVLVREQYAPQ